MYVYISDQKISAQGKENALKNEHPHHLGSGGYESALLKWKATDVILMGSSAPSLTKSEADVRCYSWLRARAVPTEEDGVFTILNPATQEVGQRVVRP